MTVAEQVLAAALPALAVQLFTAFEPIRSPGDFDDTEGTVSRLSPALAQKLRRKNVLIVRRGKSVGFLALTTLTFSRPTIVVDYDIALIEPETEDFILAHELGHVERRDVLVYYVGTSVVFALVPGLALVLGEWIGGGLGFFVGLCALLLSYIAILSLISAPLRFRQETRADRFAADLLGDSVALAGLRCVRNVFSHSNFNGFVERHGLRDLARRETYLRRVSSLRRRAQ